jgi:hypothetical protein
MITTTTTQHLGHVAGRARLVAPSSWRAAAAFGGRGLTGVDVYSLSGHGSMGLTTDTTEPATAMVNPCVTIKRSARHLGSRST